MSPAGREEDVWIATRSGVRFFPFAPRAADIRLFDIAHALSNIGRFTGHTSKFYSVAQHSVWVSLLVPERFAMAGLLHDASEAYLADIPSPMKPFFPKYREWEGALEAAVAHRFWLPHPHPPEVKDADREMFRHEVAWLFEPGSPLWERAGITERPQPMLRPAPPALAKKMFMDRFEELQADDGTALRRALG